MVSVALDNMDSGLSTEEILRAYQLLTPEAIRAAMAYASDLIKKSLKDSPSKKEIKKEGKN